MRQLEIGPSGTRVKGFETLDCVDRTGIDHVCDASQPLPFADETFALIYASHVLEHIPWYMTEPTLREWVRILAHKGVLELWVPDALKICETLVLAEHTGIDCTNLDGWDKFNPQHDPCVWAAGRLYTYGDGIGSTDHPNWHRALFTPRYLKQLLANVGFGDILIMDPAQARGQSHGWISLGVRGVKA